MVFTDILNALHTVFDTKTLISCKFTEATVPPEKKHWLFGWRAMAVSPKCKCSKAGEVVALMVPAT